MSKLEPDAISFALAPLDNERLAALCGERDTNLNQIAKELAVEITHRAGVFYVQGKKSEIRRAERVIRALYEENEQANKKKRIDAETVHMALMSQARKRRDGSPETVLKVRKMQIRPKNEAQDEYIRRVLTNEINFGIGPAGTGKTYLAVACAAEALSNNEVERIVLVRPAVEAGEKLGFLPGDIGQKVDPYLRPLYDALYEMLGFERVGKLMERGVIELAPLAFMRGRTLNRSFILLDEAQNSTVDQMKMFLTRMGYGSKIVVTGDTSQMDLPRGTLSGLVHVQRVLSDIKGVSFTHFKSKDVVRHSLVQKIVEAYEKTPATPTLISKRRHDDPGKDEAAVEAPVLTGSAGVANEGVSALSDD